MEAIAEIPASKDGVCDELDVKFAQAAKELVLAEAVERVVHSLVDGWRNESAALADANDLGNFPRLVVAQTELFAGG